MTDSNFRRGVNLDTIVVETGVTADESYTVLQSDEYILLTTTGAGANILTFGVGADGQRVMVRMAAFVTAGTYITAGIDTGEIFFGAFDEFAAFIYDANTDTWSIDGVQTGYQDITVAFGDLGSGASDTVAGVAILDAWVDSQQTTIDTEWADSGNDLNLLVGDAGDDNGIALTTLIDEVSTGPMTLALGLEAGQFNDSFTPLLTFTATELDNVTVGDLTTRIHYHRTGTV